ncbi:hypothetical protein L195_g058779, partial [Trifolium pratense]
RQTNEQLIGAQWEDESSYPFSTHDQYNPPPHSPPPTTNTPTSTMTSSILTNRVVHLFP